MSGQMSGSIVTIRINGQPYQLGCDKGQEAEIEALGKQVDGVVSSLVASVGQIGEARLLVMAALLLAEQNKAAPNKAASQSENVAEDADIERLEKLAASVSALAASLK